MTDRRRGAALKALPGFSEPEPWPFDQCQRRDPVLDLDRHPPRVVRHVGWRICLTCASPFFSQDVMRLRMCGVCKGRYEQ